MKQCRIRRSIAVTGACPGAGVVIALVLLLATVPGSAAIAAVSAAAVALAPHRAVYDIALDRASGASGVGELRGRLVYELTGNACEGYSQSMRFVTRTVSPEGAASVNDMRSTSWEDGDAGRFQFKSSQYQDKKLTEQTSGRAARKPGKDKIEVDLEKPKRKEIALPQQVYFPIQHSVALLEAAAAGKKTFIADLYDGTEKGEKVYATTSVIGRPSGGAADARLPAVKDTEGLNTMRSWPVSISYFEKDKEGADAVPVYELAFRFYENGVSRKLFIDYGEFAVRGMLSKIEFFKPAKCVPGPRNRGSEFDGRGLR